MKKQLPIVTAYTRKGKILVRGLRSSLRILDIFKGKKWAAPPQYFHDDPRHYSKKDLLFFAYKYYFKSPVLDDADGKVIAFFQANPPIFEGKILENASEVTITAAGDLMPYEWIQSKYCQHLWDDIGDDFFSSDITFANLETPVDISQPPALVPEVMLNDMHFNADEKMFDIFNATPQYRGFDVLSTANNHSLDMGENGVHATIDFLEYRGIQVTGTAFSETERLNFPIIEKNGIRIAFVAYTFSMNQIVNPEGKNYLVNHLEVNQPNVDLTPLKNDILHAKNVLKADFVVLSLHFGNAYQAYPGMHIVENAQRIFTECGPDIILGGHPHNIQPMARFDFDCPISKQKKAGFVLFSFSDFVAYDIFNECHLSVYLKIKVKKTENTEGDKVEIAEITPVPVYACGVYFNENHRELRLLDAEKTLKLIEKGEKPSFMTDWNVQELTGLMAFYRNYFAKNLP